MSNQEELNKIDIVALLENFFKTAKKFWLQMLIGIIVLTSVYYAYTRITYEPVYQSQATFTMNKQDSSLISGGSLGGEQIKESLPYIVQSQYMKNLVMDELKMTDFPAAVELESQELAEFYVLKVNAADAETANRVLHSILNNCQRASVYVLGKVSLEILDVSDADEIAINHLNKSMSLLKGAALGIFLCVLVVFFYMATNRTIQKEEDLKKYLSVSCLATLPQVTFKKRRKEFDRHIHIYNDRIAHVFLENVRTMRTRVQRSMESIGAKTILVTSSIPAEGKSTVAANLAMSLAEKGGKVILVDLDLRNPSVGDVLGSKAKKQSGVIEILNGKKKVSQQVHMVKRWNLHILYAGQPQNNPLELMNKESLEKMISELKKRFDYVVLDTPPAAMLSDASAVATYADCALYVVKQDYARIERIAEGMEALTLAQVPIIGVILNGMEKVIGTYSNYGNYRYGAYGQYTNMDEEAPEFIDLSNPWEE